jgi:hypothetical protein
MFQFFIFNKRVFLLVSILFLSSTISSFNPLETLLWPDPDFKTKLSFTKFLNFKKPMGVEEFQGTLQGSLESSMIPVEYKFKIIEDTFGINKNFKPLSKLPALSLNFSIEGSKFIPDSSALRTTQNFLWDIQYGVGEVWYDDFGNIRTSFPFSLIQKNQNCVHNGIILFDMTEGGEISNMVYQIASETCGWFRFNLIGSAEISLTNSSNLNAEKIQDYKDWKASTIPLKALSTLGESYKDLGSVKEVLSENMTVFGFYDGESHYRGGCMTRKGRYPYCSELLIPSFSLAKSIFASNVMSMLEMDFPNIKNLFISDYVPECSSKKWRSVTFENALDMATGQYKYKNYYSEDWYLEQEGYFKNFTHKDKIKAACNFFKKQINPGIKLSYHSSDTYILGTALNQFYKENVSSEGDIYYDLLLPLWNSLELSDALNEIRRSLDNAQQPYAEMGMFMLSDDVVKIGKYFLDIRRTVEEGIMFEALQKNANDRGLVAINNLLYYNKGFWVKRFSGNKFGCSSDVWIPFMSGTGGITLVLLPNNTLYYYFSDGDEYEWDRAVEFANNLRPFCS